MKNKRWLIVACTGLLCVASLTTYAYLQAMTEVKSNVFTSTKNVEAKLTEDAFNPIEAADYMPGEMIAKDPVLHNLSTDEKGTVYAALKVSYVGNEETLINKATFESTYATITGLSSNWEHIATNDSGEEIYIYKEVLDPNGGKTDALFQGVSVNKKIQSIFDTTFKINEVYYKNSDGNRVACKDIQELNEYTSYTDGAGKAIQPLTLPKFEIQIQGFVSQAYLVDKDEAVNTIIDLVNANSIDKTFKK